MSWFGIEGHDEIVRRFQRAIAQGRIASTFLFLGPSGIGKRMFAERLAMTLQCEKNDPRLMEPCGKCMSCRQALAHEHPDILYVSKPEDRAFIPIDLFIGPKDARRQIGLCSELAKKPIYEKRKIAIIDDADYFNLEGANAMLKTLEEPPKNAILILIGTSAARQLPTIRSRCQILRFSPLEIPVVESILYQKRAEQLALAESVAEAVSAQKETKRTGKTAGKSVGKNAGKSVGKTAGKSASKDGAGDVIREELIPRIAAHSNGSIQEALALADPDFWEFRNRFLRLLAEGVRERDALVGEIDQQLESAGKVPALRRARLRVMLETAADFFRRLSFRLSGFQPADGAASEEWRVLLETAVQSWPLDAEGAASAALKTADYLELVQRNVHQPTLLDAWIDEILRIRSGDLAAFLFAPWSLNPNP